jgi:ferrous iron transport protein A
VRDARNLLGIRIIPRHKRGNGQLMDMVDLTQLEEGKSGVVVEINGGRGFNQRLDSLGIRVGKKLTKVSSQFMRGPVCVRIDSYQVALGFGMAKKILVEVEK